MRIDRAAAAGGPVISGIGASGFRVEDKAFRALLITPDWATDWSPPPIAALSLDDLAPILDPAPEFILLGTGATLTRPDPQLVIALEARGVGIEAMDSRAAARAWAVLRAEGRPIAGALYPL